MDGRIKGTKLIVRALLLALFANLLMGRSHSVALAIQTNQNNDMAQPLVVTVPANSRTIVPIVGLCLDQERPFPGEFLAPIDLAPDAVRIAIAHSVANGSLEDNAWQSQLAVWSLLAQTPDGRLDNVGKDLVRFAGEDAEPSDAGSATPSIIEAMDAGAIQAQIVGFERVSRPEYFGAGLLIVTNLTDQPATFHIPYGVRAVDRSDSSNQAVAIFPREWPAPAMLDGVGESPLPTEAATPEPLLDATGSLDETGEPGPAGLSCWDTNGNGVAENEEDVNEDGTVDTLDCRGPAGETGPAGPQGPAGANGATGPASPPGMDGSDGVHCWDANKNGTADVEEDVDGDGVVDVLDCKGTAGSTGLPGVQGPAGPAGAMGLQGAPGLHCWDANMNGVPDAGEDRNGDGRLDALDCQGPMGATGPAGAQGSAGVNCWDTNKNGAADAEEDRNGDGFLDALDCQGAVGTAGEDGYHCWDTNLNGEPDAEEDRNGDGVLNATDCRGPAGAFGPAGPRGPVGLRCWDTNMNDTADAEEDINGDGLLDTNDCQDPAGSVGPVGPIGPQGPPSLLTVTRVSQMGEADDESRKSVEAICPDGLVALGGGHEVVEPASEDWIVTVTKSFPATASSWRVEARALYARIGATDDCNCDDDLWSLNAWVICAEAPAMSGSGAHAASADSVPVDTGASQWRDPNITLTSTKSTGDYWLTQLTTNGRSRVSSLVYVPLVVQ